MESTADLTPAELADIRAELSIGITDMRAEYAQSLSELDELQQAGTDGAGDDQADAGSKTFDREQELSIVANRLDLLSQMITRVDRIDAGTYGFCEICGKPIPRGAPAGVPDGDPGRGLQAARGATLSVPGSRDDENPALDRAIQRSSGQPRPGRRAGRTVRDGCRPSP